MKQVALLLILAFPSIANNLSSLAFIENKGQWPGNYHYRASIPGGFLYVSQQAFYYQLLDEELTKKMDSHHLHTEHDLHTPANRNYNLHGLGVHFEGSNSNTFFSGSDALVTRYNFYRGNDSTTWASGVQAYRKINGHDLYPNIDLTIYSNARNVKYDFHINPGGNPKAIKMNYAGADNLYLKHGNLHIETSLQHLIDVKPYAYQLINGDTIEIPCFFDLNRKTQSVTFDLPDGYNQSHELIIDPELIFSTFSGSADDNWGFSATYDNDGNTYSAGIVQGANFPFTAGAYQTGFGGGTWDVAILKFDSVGRNLLYATFLGGADTEVPVSMMVDSRDNLFILGITGSVDFPFTEPLPADKTQLGSNNPFPILSGVNYLSGSDLFIAKLNPQGSQLMEAINVGGSADDGMMKGSNPLIKNYGDEFRAEIYLDNQDNVVIGSNTYSVDFPTTNGTVNKDTITTNGIVTRFSNELTPIWSITVGDSASYETIFSIRQGSNGNYYAVGGKSSDTGHDALILEIDTADGTILNQQLFGTSAYDQAYIVDTDEEGFVYCYGQSQGNWPVQGNVYQNPGGGNFLQKRSSDLSEVVWSTVIGSGFGINLVPTAFNVNICGNILLAGWGGGSNRDQTGTKTYVEGTTFDMPITENATQSTTDGSDFYLMALRKDAERVLFASYFGDAGTNEHIDGGTSRFDKKGVIHHAVCGGCGPNGDFPTTPGAWSETNGAENCNNAVFKYDFTNLLADFQTFDAEWNRESISSECAPFTLNINNRSIGGESFTWDFGGLGTSSEVDSLSFTFEEPGTYLISLTATDETTCISQSVAEKTIQVFEGNFSIMPDTTICIGDSLSLKASGIVSYLWSADSLTNPNKLAIASPLVIPAESSTYYLTGISPQGCQYKDSIVVTALTPPTLSFNFEREEGCDFARGKITNVQIPDSATFTWKIGDELFSDLREPAYEFEQSGIYPITLTAMLGGCIRDFTKTYDIKILDVPNLITPGLADGLNDNFEVSTDLGIRPSEPFRISIFDRFGNRVFDTPDYQNNWKGDDVPAGYYFYNLTFQEGLKCKGWVHVTK